MTDTPDTPYERAVEAMARAIDPQSFMQPNMVKIYNRDRDRARDKARASLAALHALAAASGARLWVPMVPTIQQCDAVWEKHQVVYEWVKIYATAVANVPDPLAPPETSDGEH